MQRRICLCCEKPRCGVRGAELAAQTRGSQRAASATQPYTPLRQQAASRKDASRSGRTHGAPLAPPKRGRGGSCARPSWLTVRLHVSVKVLGIQRRLVPLAHADEEGVVLGARRDADRRLAARSHAGLHAGRHVILPATSTHASPALFAGWAAGGGLAKLKVGVTERARLAPGGLRGARFRHIHSTTGA